MHVGNSGRDTAAFYDESLRTEKKKGKKRTEPLVSFEAVRSSLSKKKIIPTS